MFNLIHHASQFKADIYLAASPVDRAFVESEVARLGLHAQWRQCQPA